MPVRKRLGEVLVEAGVIDQTQLRAALGHQRRWGMRLGQALVDLKLATEQQVVEALAKSLGYPLLKPATLQRGPAIDGALALVPRELALKHNLLPYACDQASVSVAMADPLNIAVVDELRFRTGRRVRVALAGDKELASAIARLYEQDAAPAPVEAIPLDESDDVPDLGIVSAFGGGTLEDLEGFFGRGAGGPPGDAAAEALAADAFVAVALGEVPGSGAPAGGPHATGAVGAAPHDPAADTAAAQDDGPEIFPPGAFAFGASTAAPRAGGEPAGDAREADLAGAPATDQELEPIADAEALPIEEAPLLGADAPLAVPALGEPPASALPLFQRPLSSKELAMLDVLERVTDEVAPQPSLVKPAEMMAALVRVLIRKGIVSEAEFLEEFVRK